MRRQVIISGLVLALLSGCGSSSGSGWNPFTWFGGGASDPVTYDEAGNQIIVLESLAPRKGYPELVDIRQLAPNLTDVLLAQSTSGAILTATSALPSLGYYDAELVKVASDRADTLTFDFRLRAPNGPAPTGTAAQRQITAAYSLSNADLVGIRTIVVRGANGARQVRR